MILKKIQKLLRPRRKEKEVVYDGSFFQSKWFENWDGLKSVLRELIREEPGWKNILDFGCGPGIMIDYMNDLGYDYVGCDYMQEPRDLYLNNYGRYPEKFITGLDQCAGRRFDLALSFDVFEHLTDREITELLSRLKDIPELLVNISRVKHIPGHINIKNDRQWIKFISAVGYEFEAEKTEKIRKRYVQIRPGCPDEWNRNIFIFSRKPSGF